LGHHRIPLLFKNCENGVGPLTFGTVLRFGNSPERLLDAVELAAYDILDALGPWLSELLNEGLSDATFATGAPSSVEWRIHRTA
jgi:hypothetical protein